MKKATVAVMVMFLAGFLLIRCSHLLPVEPATAVPPVVSVMADTSVFASDSITVIAAAIDNGSVQKYVWAKDGLIYADTTHTGLLTVAYTDSGRKVVRVKAIDNDGLVSQPDSCIIIVSPHVEPIPQPEIQNVHTTYVLMGNSLELKFQDSSYQHPACNGSVLTTVIDTIVLRVTDTVQFIQTGDTFLLENQVDSADGRYLDTAAVVHKYERFLRQGAGSGLIGAWKYDGLGYIVTAGQLTALEIAHLDSAVIESKFWMFNSNDVTFTFTATSLTITTVMKWSELLIFYWNNNPNYSPDSSLWDIDLIEINVGKIRMIGNISHEQVTVTYDSLGNWKYQSTDTAHHAYTYYSSPTTCPNNFRPSWYQAFLYSNVNGTPKMRMHDEWDINRPLLFRNPARLKASW